MEGDRDEPLTDSSIIQSRRAPDALDVVSVNKKHSTKLHRRIKALRTTLQSDIFASDLKWSLFVAACQSYRFDSCLRPYPPAYINGEGLKVIDELREVVDKTPTLSLFVDYLGDPISYQTEMNAADLMHWVLVTMREPKLKIVPKTEFQSILHLVPSELSAQEPNFIFQTLWDPESPSEQKWKALCQDYKSMYAYHGSRLENFHSILHYGLQQHMNKNSLFGQGIYLSSELTVSLPYSPTGYGWGGSLLGSDLSCVALCELVDHPDVKCKSDRSDVDPVRCATSDSIGGDVPLKYYVVVNNDLVRVRYLLVYGKSSPLVRSTPSSERFGWIKRHKFLTAILAYVCLLAAVGISNSQIFQKNYKKFLRRMGW